MRVESHPGRLLIDHVKGVYHLMSGELESSMKYIDFENLFGITMADVQIIVKAIALLHDLGKATPFFQKKLKGEIIASELSQHALLGFVAVANYLTKYMKSSKSFAIPLAAIVVRQHHSKALSPLGGLSISTEQREVLQKQKENLIDEYLKELSKYIEIPNISYQAIVKNSLEWREPFLNRTLSLKGFMLYSYLSSLLTWADKTDAAFKGLSVPNRQEIPEDIIENYRNAMNFNKPKTTINKMRNEFYLESNKHTDFDIATLKGRTGIGKTLTVLSVALKKREEIQKAKGYTPRIIYCLPFLSIIDQTYDTMVKILRANDIVSTEDVIMQQHHLANLEFNSHGENDEIIQYETYMADILLNSWNSELVITTFVSLFQSVFTNRRNSRFFRIPGSIIILDEVQAIPVKYWLLVKKTFEELSKHAGTKIIFSTATMPKSFLIDSKSLVKKDFEFDRFDLIPLGKLNFEEFKADIVPKYVKKAGQENKSIMIVMNTIRSAKEVYESLQSKDAGYFYLSSHLPPSVRRDRISKVRKREGFKVLVTTQLVEAGVDLSFNYCIRDFGPLDSITQISGRVNRSNEKDKGKILVPKLISEKSGRLLASWVYDPVILHASEEILNEQTFSEPKLYKAAEKYFEELEKKGFEGESKKILEALEKVDFEAISEFKLIENDEQSVSVFVEINKDAEQVWGKYCDILENKTIQADKYAQIAKKKQTVRNLAPYLISFRINPRNTPNLPPLVHGFYYVSNDQLENYYDKDTGFHPGEADIY